MIPASVVSAVMTYSIRCSRCQRDVEHIERRADLSTGETVFVLRCHGVTQRVHIPERALLAKNWSEELRRRLSDAFKPQPVFRIRTRPGHGKARCCADAHRATP